MKKAKKSMLLEAQRLLGPSGKLLGSKGRYCFYNPDHVVVFNSKIKNSKGEIIWRGDLDLTEKLSKVEKLAALGNVFIVNETEEYCIIQVLKGKLQIISDSIILENKKLILKGSFSKKEEFEKEIKLPDLISFRSMSKKESPFDKLYAFVFKKIGKVPKGKLVNVSSLFMREDDLVVMEWLHKEWLRKVNKLDEYAVEKETSFLFLDISPSTLSRAGWAKPGHIYAKKDIFQDKR